MIVGLLVYHDARWEKRRDTDGETVPVVILVEYRMAGKGSQAIRLKKVCKKYVNECKKHL